MKRILFVSFLLILAASASYFLWKINHPVVVGVWDLVPEDALMVYERNTNSTIDDAEWLLKSFVPDSLRKNLRAAKEMLISIHVIGKEEVGTVLYLPGASSMKESIALLKSNRAFTQRNFEGFTIIEVPQSNKKIVSIVTIDQILILSSTSFLIEDIIRLAKSEEKRNFTQNNKPLFQFARMDSDGGHVYVNLSQLPKFLDFFLVRKNQNPILDHFARSGVVDIKKQDHTLLLSGFAIDSLSRDPSILSLFNQQRPVPISLQGIISGRTGLLVHYGISDFSTWTPGRLAFCKASHKPVADSLKSLQERYGFEADTFYRALGDEMGICLAGVFSGELLIVELKDENQAINELKKLHTKNKADSLQGETYSHYQIHPLNVPGLPTALFWPLTNHSMNYYFVADRHLIFSEELEDIKSLIDDLDAENTWGKSTEWNAFLSTSQETNAGIIVDGMNSWPALKTVLTPKWQSFGDSTRFLNLNKGSFQFTRLERSYYFNGVLEFNTSPSPAALEQKEKVLEITLAQPVMGPLTVVRNHTTGGSELLVQDDANNILLFSPKLKNIFTERVVAPIRSEVSQIDYYRNKKLQYLFATDRSVYLIDRLGRTVPGFPKPLVLKSPIRFLSVVDYGNTRDYQFLISDAQGRITLYDREVKPVADWLGVELNKELWVAPRPLRSKGKDYIFAVTQDGIVYGFTRKGEPLPGFPVNLKVRPRGTWVLEKSDDRETITLISDEGILIQLDLKGKIINRNNFIKSSAASVFSLEATANGHFVISRTDKNKMAVLDGRGNILFEKDNPGSNELFLTYFEAGHGKKLFGFTDPQQEFTYFFDENGRSVFSRPLENQQKPAIAVDKGSLYFYGVNKNRIQSYRPARVNH